MLTKALKQDEAVRAHHAHRESAAVAKGSLNIPTAFPIKRFLSKAAITPPVLKDIVAGNQPATAVDGGRQVFLLSLCLCCRWAFMRFQYLLWKTDGSFCGVTEPVEFVHHRLESIVDGVEDRVHAWIVNIAESEDILALEELERTEHPNTLFLFEAELTHQCIEI